MTDDSNLPDPKVDGVGLTIKEYEVIRCIGCNGIMKVPYDALNFICPHCGEKNEFTVETTTSSSV